MYYSASFFLSHLFTACSLEISSVKAALFLMVLHGLHLPGSNRSNCVITVLCTYLFHASGSDGGHIVLLPPMDWWSSTLHILFFKWMMLTFQEIWTRSFFFDAPVWTGRWNAFSMCNRSHLYDPTAICSCCIFISDPTPYSETAFQATFHESTRCSFLPSFHCLWDVNNFLARVE